MRHLKRIASFTLLAIAAGIALFPFLWLLSTSFKGAEELFAFPPKLIPDHFIWENYSGVWNAVPFSAYTINSVIVSVASIVLNVLFSSLAGFALALGNSATGSYSSSLCSAR